MVQALWPTNNLTIVLNRFYIKFLLFYGQVPVPESERMYCPK